MDARACLYCAMKAQSVRSCRHTYWNAPGSCWGCSCSSCCPPCWWPVPVSQNDRCVQSCAGMSRCQGCRPCQLANQNWSPQILVPHRYLKVKQARKNISSLLHMIFHKLLLSTQTGLQILQLRCWNWLNLIPNQVNKSHIIICLLFSLPRAQTFVVTRTFSFPSLKRSMTAALCSTCISPLSSATWWPSLDSSPANQPAVFLVWITEKRVSCSHYTWRRRRKKKQ